MNCKLGSLYVSTSILSSHLVLILFNCCHTRRFSSCYSAYMIFSPNYCVLGVAVACEQFLSLVFLCFIPPFLFSSDSAIHAISQDNVTCHCSLIVFNNCHYAAVFIPYPTTVMLRLMDKLPSVYAAGYHSGEGLGRSVSNELLFVLSSSVLYLYTSVPVIFMLVCVEVTNWIWGLVSHLRAGCRSCTTSNAPNSNPNNLDSGISGRQVADRHVYVCVCMFVLLPMQHVRNAPRFGSTGPGHR